MKHKSLRREIARLRKLTIRQGKTIAMLAKALADQAATKAGPRPVVVNNTIFLHAETEDDDADSWKNN